MMTTHQILLLLIDEYIFGVTTTYKTDTTLFVWLAQKPKYFIVLHKYVAKNPELFHDTPDFEEDFDSPICLACTMANASIFTTARSLFPTNMMLLKVPKD